MFGIFDVVCILHNEAKGTFAVGYFEDREPWESSSRPRIHLEGRVHLLAVPTHDNALAEIAEIRKKYKLGHPGNLVTDVVYPIPDDPRAGTGNVCWTVPNWQSPKPRPFTAVFPGRPVKMNAWASILDTDPFG
jgi:hypothetical protein